MPAARPALRARPAVPALARPAPARPIRPVGASRIRPGRLAAAAIATGALATAGHSLAGLDQVHDRTAPPSDVASLSLASGTSAAPAGTPGRAAPAGPDAATSGVLPAVPARAPGGSGHVGSLAKAGKRAQQARPVPFVLPARGRFTSGFGARWGASHQGVDIANAIGTPIVSVADGVVTAAGPASGFGQWVKVRLADGSETVYGHVNRFFVHTGQQVAAGQRIAEIGDKGESTGPHLHFEVHTPSGKKINPLPWLAERGISLGSLKE